MATKKACPFCGYCGVPYYSLNIANTHGYNKCPNCGAAGPTVLTKGNIEPGAPWLKEADEAWDRRATI